MTQKNNEISQISEELFWYEHSVNNQYLEVPKYSWKVSCILVIIILLAKLLIYIYLKSILSFLNHKTNFEIL